MTIKNPFTPGMPVDIEDIAAHVAHQRGLGAGGPDAFQSFMAVAELTAVVAKTNQIVRLTDEGLVDVTTGVSLDDMEDMRRRFRAYAPALEPLTSDKSIPGVIRMLKAEGIDI